MDSHFQYPHAAPSNGSALLTYDPTLFFLRDAITDELGAIVGYLECADLAKDYRISAQFREIANDEMEHFIRLMAVLAQMDLIQANEFQKAGISEMFMGHGGPNSSVMGIPVQCQACSQPHHYHQEYNDKRNFMIDERTMECLQNAIRDELRAINAYQKQITEIANPVLQNLLTSIMNQEKEHLSKFTKLFYIIYDN